jgi:hypothetical protein
VAKVLRPMPVCVECGATQDLASVSLLVFFDRRQKCSKSFRVCIGCIERWSYKSPRPRLRGILRRRLQETYKAIPGALTATVQSAAGLAQ